MDVFVGAFLGISFATISVVLMNSKLLKLPA
jgi:hypothetical protein